MEKGPMTVPDIAYEMQLDVLRRSRAQLVKQLAMADEMIVKLEARHPLS